MELLSLQEFYDYCYQKKYGVKCIRSVINQDSTTTKTFEFTTQSLKTTQDFVEYNMKDPHYEKHLLDELDFPSSENTSLLPEPKPEDRTFSFQNIISILGNIKSIFKVHSAILSREDSQNYFLCQVSKDFQRRTLKLKLFKDTNGKLFVDYQSYLDSLALFQSITFEEFEQHFTAM